MGGGGLNSSCVVFHSYCCLSTVSIIKNCLSDSYLSVEKHNFIPFFTSVGKHSLHVEISAIIQMYNAHLMNMNEQ